MAAAPPPPPPIPPPSFGIPPKRTIHSPCPAYAAIPFVSNDIHPIQETSPSQDAQGAATPSPHSDNLSDHDDKHHPVQETDPAPQALNGPQSSTVQLSAEAEVQDEVAFQMNQDEEEHLA